MAKRYRHAPATSVSLFSKHASPRGSVSSERVRFWLDEVRFEDGDDAADAVEEGVTHESILLESLADDLFADVPAIDRIMADDPLEFAIRAPSVSAHRPRAAQISVLTRRLSVHRLWSFAAFPVTSRWLRACRPPTFWRSAGRRLRQRRRGRR